LILINAVDVDRGHAVDGSHDPDAIHVVDKLADDRRTLLEFGQPVLIVEVKGVRYAADGAGPKAKNLSLYL